MNFSYDKARLWLETIPPHSAPGRRAAELHAEAVLISTAIGVNAVKCNEASGMPYAITDGHRYERNISLSHCHGLAALAVAEHGYIVGVDAETLRPQLEKIAERVFSPEEIEVYTGDDLLRAWTLKEAVYKAMLTPGLDFRSDIKLPLDGGIIVNCCGTELEIVDSFPAGEAWISLVVRPA